ncbi:DUF6502 family protein [Thiomicrorhabdus sp. Milos-T2]|uniref:DUF6502 family protein n=1 Tax=Thiomicrorhabdus sp. Milos-T2 TaxID=90814 RepID=UPI000690AC7B|nr:DUF6502 family protein [Thiomicrorhabdus sp. Milos-T2]
MTQETTTPLKEKALAKALSNMLRPLVRLLIHQDITYIGLLNLLKRTYVEVAEESFTIENKKLTDSRISLLTGIHRGDVKRIRTENLNQPTEKELKASLSSQLISIWMGHQGYINKNGEPLALFRYQQDGSPSFEELVFSVSKDKHPRSILDEWLSQNLVELVTKNKIEKVQLSQASYVPAEDFEEKLFFAGKNIGSHLTTVAHNLENQVPAMFDRAVYYSGLTEASIQKLEASSNEKMLAALTELNQLASQLQEQDKNSEHAKKANREMHVGAYFCQSLTKQPTHSKD